MEIAMHRPFSLLSTGQIPGTTLNFVQSSYEQAVRVRRLASQAGRCSSIISTRGHILHALAYCKKFNLLLLHLLHNQ
jgi:hypothetical protein